MTRPGDPLQTSVDDLISELRNNRLGLEMIEARLNRQAKLTRVAIATGIVAVLVLAGISTSNGQAISSNNRLLCPLISILASNDPPRETAAGRQQVVEARRLQHSAAYACP